ncbi:hypothetical protein N752_27820 [Desulforamulus aquiferis]|nr:anti-sigma factor [Desulforamulus aquiferis]RYD01934.1 hypothetical protein N752_27820 [Desulforamulus aquiferis]
MRCQDVMEKLSLYLDGVLESSEREVIKAHLACCPACRAEWEELTLSVSLLQELPELAPPAGFRAGLMEKIDQLPAPVRAPQNKRWFERISEVSKSRWYQTAAVAAVMAMTLGLTSLWEKDGNQFMPVDPRPDKGIAQLGEHPGKTDTNNVTVDPGVEPDPGAVVTDPGTQVETPNNSTTKPNQPGNAVNEPGKVDNGRGFESIVMQPSEGIISSSATLRIDVQELSAALKTLGTITQSNSAQSKVPILKMAGRDKLASGSYDQLQVHSK